MIFSSLSSSLCFVYITTMYSMILCVIFLFFFFKQKTAYEMRISDWSSDVCSSDLRHDVGGEHAVLDEGGQRRHRHEAAAHLEEVAQLLAAVGAAEAVGDRKSVV